MGYKLELFDIKGGFVNILCKRKDGGKDSPVDAYFLFEIKGWCSIALLKFNKGCREQYHSHAFDALTWKLWGDLEEERICDDVVEVTQYKRSLWPKVTRKDNLHRVKALKDSWCFTIRGKWGDTWTEYDQDRGKITTLTHGRKEINVDYWSIPCKICNALPHELQLVDLDGAGNNGYFLTCPECKLKTKPRGSLRQSIIEWNSMHYNYSEYTLRKIIGY